MKPIRLTVSAFGPYAGEADDSILWTATAGSREGVFYLNNSDGQYLTYSGESGAGVSVSLFAKTSAATPATNGAENDVPLPPSDVNP